MIDKKLPHEIEDDSQKNDDQKPSSNASANQPDVVDINDTEDFRTVIVNSETSKDDF